MTTDRMADSFIRGDNLLTILDNFHDGIYITDNRANTVYINNSYEQISGLTKAEMLGKNMQELQDRGVISISGTLKVLESRTPYTIEQSFRTGKRAIITSNPIFDDTGEQIVMVVTTVREITEIYSIRKELRRKEKLNQKYFNELEQLRKELDGNVDMVAADNRSVSMLRFAERVAMVDSPVLLTGEQGVGKEKVASFIHQHSGRCSCMFLRLSFAALPRDGFLEYLFGGTDKSDRDGRMGILESAEGGTVYIDELSEIPPQVQARLLPILNGEPCMTGDGALRKLDLRFIVGTRFSLEQLQKHNEINREVLARLSLFPVTIPPLRDRRDDIIPLLQFFLGQYNQKTGEHKRFDRESYEKLLAYNWPGNVQELRNLVERAAVVSEENVIGPEDLFVEENIEYIHQKLEHFPGRISLKDEVEKLEAQYMTEAFQRYGNIRAAADSLGMDGSTFARKRQHYEEIGLMKRSPSKKNAPGSIGQSNRPGKMQ